ncbi:MAG: hypothetical protein ACRDFB_05275 [Rhabdochlamydiaceae bacterium]
MDIVTTAWSIVLDTIIPSSPVSLSIDGIVIILIPASGVIINMMRARAKKVDDNIAELRKQIHDLSDDVSYIRGQLSTQTQRRVIARRLTNGHDRR